MVHSQVDKLGSALRPIDKAEKKWRAVSRRIRGNVLHKIRCAILQPSSQCHFCSPLRIRPS